MFSDICCKEVKGERGRDCEFDSRGGRMKRGNYFFDWNPVCTVVDVHRESQWFFMFLWEGNCILRLL